MRLEERNSEVRYLTSAQHGMHLATIYAMVENCGYRFSWRCSKHFEKRCKECGLSIEDALFIIDLRILIPKGGYNLYAISRQLTHQLDMDAEYHRLLGWGNGREC